MKRKTIGKTIGYTATATAVLLVLAAGVTGCAGGVSPGGGSSVRDSQADPAAALPAAIAATDATMRPKIDYHLSETKLPLRQWRSDGSHLREVTGRLLIDGRPVAGAVLHSGANLFNIVTAADGSFRWRVDQSRLAAADVRVYSLDQASVGGQPVRPDEADRLMKSSARLNVYYPIRVTKVLESVGRGQGQDQGQGQGPASEVEVHARIVSAKGDAISFFQADKYRISGTVKDAEGRPVRSAIVWIDRDHGEGFGKSTPTDARGEYQIFYLPEEEEDTNLAVAVGTKRYTLPKNRVLHIPEDTSVTINITLPKEGTIIGDQAPELECARTPGTMYTGVLAGLAVPPGTRYTATIPDDQGNFVVKIAKEAWDRHPAFFEARLSKFVEDRKLKAGDPLSAEFLQPGANDPQGIAPEYE